MLNFNDSNLGTRAVLALLIGATAVAPLLPLTPASAQLFPAPTVTTSDRVVIPVGTRIPVKYEDAEKILVTPEETAPLTLTVAANIKDRNGRILIPYGSEIVGQIEPAGRGSRFVAEELKVSQNEEYSFNATSGVVTRTETIEEGASTGDILTGTVAGAGAAALIAGLTGDRHIDVLEVLAGAAVGTFAGWALPEAGVIGGGSHDVISINPNRDLTLTLQSQLTVYPE